MRTIFKILIFGATLFFLCCQPVLAMRTDCVNMGMAPQWILSLPQQETSAQPRFLTAKDLTSFSKQTGLKFTHISSLTSQLYLASFTPVTSYHGCYPKAWVRNIQHKLTQLDEIKNAYPQQYIPVATHFNQEQALPNPATEQWEMINDIAAGGIGMPTAWAITGGSRNAIVAVMDTGIVENDSLSPNVLESYAGTFNNGQVTAGATPSCSNCLTTVHGTHTGGTVASIGNGAYSENVFGMAYQSKIIPMNVFRKITNTTTCTNAGVSAPCLLTTSTDIFQGLRWLAGTDFSALPSAPNVVAVNMSLLAAGDTCPSFIQNEIDTLYDNNVTVVAAAGNNNIDAGSFFPINCNHVVGVLATGKENQKSNYSNYGSVIDVAAPGGDSGQGSLPRLIYSTVADGYFAYEGTSMATPHVAGLVALLLSVDPTLTVDQVTTLLTGNVTAFAAGTGTRDCSSIECGAGIINAGAAVTAANEDKPSLNWTPDFQETLLSNSSARISWNAASWSNAASTAIKYTVKVDGVAVNDCTAITATTCTLTDLNNVGGTVNFSVEATDGRAILTPDVEAGSFESLTAPTLTTASRLPGDSTQAYINYSDAGSSDLFNSYHINGLSGAVVTDDTANNRFLITNISRLAAVSVSITGITADDIEATSNSITLPAFNTTAPTLNSAERLSSDTTKAYVSYSNLGTHNDTTTYTVNGLTGASVSLDQANNRFIISNINTDEAATISINSSTDGVQATSNTVSLAAVPPTPVTLSTANRLTSDTTTAYINYTDLGTNTADTSYTINGLTGASISLDASNSRFIVAGISTESAVSISVTSTTDDVAVTSNTITLPGVQATAPTLTKAVRNPLQPAEAWLYYSNAGSFDSQNSYTVSQLSGTQVRLDASNQRFVIDNIQTAAQTPVTVTVTNGVGRSASSNQLVLPGILR